MLPAQSPEAVHPVAFVEDHVSVELPPDVTVVGFALKLTVGAATMLIVTDFWVVPPEPVHDNPKVVAAVIGLALALPCRGFEPAQPDVPPLAVQLVASDVLHVSCVEPFNGTDVGFAERVTDGAGVLPPETPLKPGCTVQPGFVLPVHSYAPASGGLVRFVPLKSCVVMCAAAPALSTAELAVGQRLRCTALTKSWASVPPTRLLDVGKPGTAGLMTLPVIVTLVRPPMANCPDAQ